MHIPKFSTKRVLGLTLAAALAVTGSVALANSSQATATPTASLTPATGAAAGGTVVTIKGKGFEDTTGAVQVLALKFTTAACTSTVATGTAATTFNVTSATTAVATTPALTAGTYFVCLLDAASGTTANILGQGKFVTAAAPTATTISPAASNIAKASALGGTSVAVTGSGFDKAVKATIGGLVAKATYVSATKVSVVLPAHAVATSLKIALSTEYGTASTTDTVSYVAVVSVSPTSGDGTAGNVVNLTGVGFSGYTFGAAVTNDVVVFVPAGTTLTGGTTTIAALNPCTSVQVVSDTSLNCQAPTLTGAYSVMIVARDGTTAADYGSSVSTVSKSATYTAAAF